jgi:hypothetical protein
MAKRRCTATTKAGKRCRRRPAAGGGRCAVHSGGQLDGLTPAVQERVCQALRAGAHMEQAATFAGVHRATVHRWLARGESDDAPERFRDFAAAVREAEAGFEIASLALIARAGDEEGAPAPGWSSAATRDAGDAARRSSCPAPMASRYSSRRSASTGTG